jgi:hypothetical protein
VRQLTEFGQAPLITGFVYNYFCHFLSNTNTEIVGIEGKKLAENNRVSFFHYCLLPVMLMREAYKIRVKNLPHKQNQCHFKTIIGNP